MAIPDFQSVMRPVLATVQDGAPLPLNELRERVAEHFQLTEEERKERLPSGHQTVINRGVAARGIEPPRRGMKYDRTGDAPKDAPKTAG
nr:winged helix-turn-helix domain-containing protein [Pseudomonas sp. s4]